MTPDQAVAAIMLVLGVLVFLLCAVFVGCLWAVGLLEEDGFGAGAKLEPGTHRRRL